ncbi:MAG: right-handed parallel beta-helix repeat-containing protein [Lewinellaceae bacterium]|nr:right-handed parallel beta-helix repeat-containing protein [Saprospiraceae bacterium]MCB9338217.1 right-handed parallel beta-helix repeat-containing protein [Lewinellaceae bacterium]
MKYFLLLIPFALALLTSCSKEEKFTTNGGDKLEFSVDTLRFDTVFTELGSATRFFRIYNRHKESIRISKIQLMGNQQSKFNLNVDGIPGDSHEEVVVYPNDSIYVFAEVTINPDDPLSASPFFVYDSVMFETNGNKQYVTLEAWGQNANYIPNRWSKDSIVLYSCGGGEVVWDDPKPYVIYGVVAFDNCTLTIPAGARIYVHGGLSRTIDPTNDETIIYNSGRLFFLENGRLQVLGTKEDSVVIQGDRLEQDFANADGQWTGIIFGAGSSGHRLEYATIKNSLFGIYVDSAAELSMKNCKVFNTSGAGLLAIHSQVEAENCLFYNNGDHSVQLSNGGNYNFTYCTLANYGTDVSALEIGNGVCGDADCTASLIRINPLSASFVNCIIFGSKKDEISISDFTGQQGQDASMLSYHFSHCIVRVGDLTDPARGFPDFFTYCDPCINATSADALFVSTGEDDYHLDTLSIAEGKALPLFNITIDLVNNMRDPVMPDIGCFEYQYE